MAQGLSSDVRWIRPADYINRNKYCQVEIAFADTVTDVAVVVNRDTGSVPKDSILITPYQYYVYDRSYHYSDALSQLKTTASVVSFLYQFKTLDNVSFNVAYKNASDITHTTKYIWFDVYNGYAAPNHNYNGLNQEVLDDYF